MSKVIPFKKEHLEVMEIRDYEKQTVCERPEFKRAMAIWETSRIAGTIVYDGRILAIMGSLDLWPGVCELFVLPSKYLSQYPIPFARCIKHAIYNSGMFDNYGRVQIQAADDKLHNRWLKFLNFEKEGTLRKYGLAGEDINMWARVK